MSALEMIEDAGFEALEAADATEAVRILETHPDVRIVFTDIQMPPGIDGMERAARIRDRWPPIDLILTSGHFDPKEVALPPRGLFFAKPYNEKHVIAAIRTFVS
jgi:CheY-like chemotaxis protein